VWFVQWKQGTRACVQMTVKCVCSGAFSLFKFYNTTLVNKTMTNAEMSNNIVSVCVVPNRSTGSPKLTNEKDNSAVWFAHDKTSTAHTHTQTRAQTITTTRVTAVQCETPTTNSSINHWLSQK